MGTIEIFKKQGGMQLIKNYLHNGTFFTALMEFLLLGKSRTALETLRLAVELKTKQKYEKKYKHVLEQQIARFDETLPHEQNDTVWFCWFQGLEEAPPIVKLCYNSACRVYGKDRIIFITEKNYQDYVTFPSYIQEKIDNHVIRGAHFSDLVRLELLIRHGGTWTDATAFYSGPVPDYYVNSEFFTFQTMKPGRDGHALVVSNWFISTKSNNKILCLTRDLLYAYWKDNNAVWEYFIFHVFFQMVIEALPEEWDRVPPVTSSTPHILLLRFFEPYDEQVWKAILQQTPIHKLSYKYSEEEASQKNTFYAKLMEEYMGEPHD